MNRLYAKYNCSTNGARSILATLAFCSASVWFCLVPAMPLLFWLMGPTIIPNPGRSAHNALPGTRVEPLPRKMEWLALAEPSDLGLLSNLARNYARPYLPLDYAEQEHTETPTKRQVRVSGPKRSRLARGRKDNERSYAYAPDWNGNRHEGAR
jgi:hypothetical protein